MANTTFSGPVIATNGFVMPLETAANIGDAAHAINTTNKVIGRTVIDSTNNKVYYAAGVATTSVWQAFDKGATAGGADITPS
jgi:hypothetical protein